MGVTHRLCDETHWKSENLRRLQSRGKSSNMLGFLSNTACGDSPHKAKWNEGTLQRLISLKLIIKYPWMKNRGN